MKTNFLLTSLVIVLFTLTANSQITKGNWMVGGDGNYYNHTYNKVSNIQYSINPDIGYFIKDKLVLGVGFNFEGSSKSNFSKISRTLGANVYTRYYLLKPEKIFNIFSQMHYKYSNYKSYTASRSTHFYVYGVKTGIVLFFTNSVGLELSVEYDKSTSVLKDAELTNTNSILLIGNIGFHIHLEKDK